VHYVRARWYGEADPHGWLSADPLGFEGRDWNRYRYLRNRPTVKVDPSGLFAAAKSPVPVFTSSALEYIPLPGLGFVPRSDPLRLRCHRHARRISGRTGCYATTGHVVHDCSAGVGPELRSLIDSAVGTSFTCAGVIPNTTPLKAQALLADALYCLTWAESKFDPAAHGVGPYRDVFGLFQWGMNEYRNCGASSPHGDDIGFHVQCALETMTRQVVNAAAGGKRSPLYMWGALQYWDAFFNYRVGKTVFNSCMDSLRARSPGHDWYADLHQYSNNPCNIQYLVGL
jgi:hypothetical protein